MLAQCATVRPAPVALFRSALLHASWAVRHAAMESLAAYTRAAVDDGDLRSVVPAELLAPGMGVRHMLVLRWTAVCAEACDMPVRTLQTRSLPSRRPSRST